MRSFQHNSTAWEMPACMTTREVEWRVAESQLGASCWRTSRPRVTAPGGAACWGVKAGDARSGPRDGQGARLKRRRCLEHETGPIAASDGSETEREKLSVRV